MDHILAARKVFDSLQSAKTKHDVFEDVFGFSKRFGFTNATMGLTAFPGLHDIDYADLGVSLSLIHI